MARNEEMVCIEDDNPIQLQATQFLCNRCQGIFQDEDWHREDGQSTTTKNEQNTITESGGTGAHHPTFHSLINSAIQGCYICVLLWERIPQDVKKGLLTLCSDSTLVQYSYFFYNGNESQRKRLEVYTNPVHNLALCPQGTGAIMVTLNSLPTNDLHQYKPAVDAGTSTNSSAAWTCMAKWLENCSKHHASCGHPPESPYASGYPTRLLDVGIHDSGNNNIKLVETNTVIPEGPYVTLSHCWGRRHIISLTKATMKQFLLGVPAVPKTYGDAIVVARKLHVRYLWIDSLCIIQDDLDDWRTESLLMDQIYKNALFNIGATAASDSLGGLFYSRPHLVPCCQVQLGEENVRFTETSLFTAEVENSPLMQRAWVLQECLLAPRVLHFGRKQLFWECNELCASETFPDGPPPGVPQYEIQRLRARINAIALNSGLTTKEHKREALEIWRLILWRYTSSSLTFRTDKLPALAGIVKHIQPLFSNTYLVGIWKDSIILLLGWYCLGEDRRRILSRQVGYRAPTWSWASTDNPITFWLPYPLSETVFDLKVLAFEATTIGDDPAGHVTSGYLLVEGPLNLVTVDKSSVSLHESSMSLHEEWTDLAIGYHAPWLDEYTELAVDLYCLPLHHTVVPKNRNSGEYDDCHSGSVLDENTYIISFLLLKPRTDCLGSYTRCGVWRSEGTEKLLRVQNGHEAPCEEFIGLERGHRIRIY